MSSEENKALLRAVIEQVFTGKDLTRIDSIFDADVVNHSLPPGLPSGREGVRVAIAGFLAAFPDVRVIAEELLTEGDKAVARWSAQGTHLGAFNGIPPTGRTVRVSGIVICRLRDGRIVEEWEQFDLLGLLQQLGAIPAPVAAPA
jgi:steroid delta-isomerase-like uncharacterized protein